MADPGISYAYELTHELVKFEQIAQAVLFSSWSAILNEVSNSHYVGAWLQCLCNLHSKDFLNSVVVGHIARRPRVAMYAS